MSEYEQIMTVDSVIPFVIGFGTQGFLAALQTWLALAFIGSGLINLFRHQDIVWLRYLGATTNLLPRQKRKAGLLQLVLGSLLLLPAILGLHFLIALSVFVGLILFIVIYEKQPPFDGKYTGKFTRYGFIFFIMACATFTGYDNSDPLSSTKQFAADVAEWRPKEQAWQNQYDVDAPKTGDNAPEFTLLNANGKSTAKLADFLGEKPVVLFLGANTCPVFSHGLGGINELYEKYKNKVNFVGIYVSEPHATDEWPLASNNFMKLVKELSAHPVAIDIKQHTSFEDRLWAANRLKRNLVNQDIPILVDNMNNEVNNTWVGRPARLYLLSPEGTVLYNPGKGPYSFNPDYLAPILDDYFSNQSSKLSSDLSSQSPRQQPSLVGHN